MPNPELIETREGPIAYLTLNRPAAMNAITVSLANALRQACLRLQGHARVIVLRGAGPHFCVGGDITDLAARRSRGAAGIRELLDAFGALCQTIEQLRVPVIAAVRGYALAGGFELIQCCDLALLADDARLGDHHARMDVIPGGGSSQRLPRILGRPRALALLLTGEHLTADQAVAWGLAYRAYPPDRLDGATAELAAQLAERDPTAIAATKALATDALRQPLTDGLERERSLAAEDLASDYGLGLIERVRAR